MTLRLVQTRHKVTVYLPCAHHWRLEEANGPTSRGECRLCHAVRTDFANSGDYRWDERAFGAKAREAL